MSSRVLIVGAAMLVLSGCISRESFKTEPVLLETPKGNVWCQLYIREVVKWDQAIRHPATMPSSEADTYCIREGKRRAQL